ncbi:MAG: hypothetical protein R2790_02315 [Flavobacterium haoranii]
MNKRKKVLSVFKGFSLQEIKREVNLKIIKLGTPSAMQNVFEVALFTGAIWFSGRLELPVKQQIK